MVRAVILANGNGLRFDGLPKWRLRVGDEDLASRTARLAAAAGAQVTFVCQEPWALAGAEHLDVGATSSICETILAVLAALPNDAGTAFLLGDVCFARSTLEAILAADGPLFWGRKMRYSRAGKHGEIYALRLAPGESSQRIRSALTVGAGTGGRLWNAYAALTRRRVQVLLKKRDTFFRQVDEDVTEDFDAVDDYLRFLRVIRPDDLA